MKLGGSLLDLPDLAARLEDWLTNQPPMLNLCIAGGGEPVQEIKDRSGSVDSSNSHWECIRLMDRHSLSLSQISRAWSFLDSPDSLSSLPHSPPATVYFLGIESWLRETMTCLPESWDVTSDSIAVVLARFFGASELTLLKSALPPTQTTLTQLMDLEFVDRYFKEAITSAVTEQLSNIGRVKFVNLRDENYAEHCLSCPSAH